MGDRYKAQKRSHSRQRLSDRLLDPVVLRQTRAVPNASAFPQLPPSRGTVDRFLTLWRMAKEVAKDDRTQWRYLWMKMRKAMPTSLAVRGLRAGDCADPLNCIGTSLEPEGACVCTR